MNCITNLQQRIYVYEYCITIILSRPSMLKQTLLSQSALPRVFRLWNDLPDVLVAEANNEKIPPPHEHAFITLINFLFALLSVRILFSSFVVEYFRLCVHLILHCI